MLSKTSLPEGIFSQFVGVHERAAHACPLFPRNQTSLRDRLNVRLVP